MTQFFFGSLGLVGVGVSSSFPVFTKGFQKLATPSRLVHKWQGAISNLHNIFSTSKIYWKTENLVAEPLKVEPNTKISGHDLGVVSFFSEIFGDLGLTTSRKKT